jgi:hypothetical protein
MLFIDFTGEEVNELVCERLLWVTFPELLTFRLLINKLFKLDCVLSVLELVWS